MLSLIGSLPPLRWVPHEGSVLEGSATSLTILAPAGTDWSNDAFGTPGQHDAAVLGFVAPPQFTLSARVRVASPRTTFDAGVLALWVDRDHWAKLCFERSPQGEDMVVSVVTDGFSDDCNSTIVTDDAVYLRIVRNGPAWGFHSSADGVKWDFVRQFRFAATGEVTVGFMSQAPMGPRCVAVFDAIELALSTVEDLRDRS